MNAGSPNLAVTQTGNAVEQVILVDEHDRPIGVAEKLAAHQDGGRLHRAFSVCVFNDAGELLLQKRGPGKYHFGGLWSNTCCGHPRPGEPTRHAARRRLREEFGFVTGLREAGAFTYHMQDTASGLAENEIDHVFAGCFNGNPKPAPTEIEDWKWTTPAALRDDMARQPDHFTPWLSLVLAKIDEAGVRE